MNGIFRLRYIVENRKFKYDTSVGNTKKHNILPEILKLLPINNLDGVEEQNFALDSFLGVAQAFDRV